jgi:hypothetical protein
MLTRAIHHRDEEALAWIKPKFTNHKPPLAEGEKQVQRPTALMPEPVHALSNCIARSLVEQLQVHRFCTDTCKASGKGQQMCRFGLPAPIIEETIAALLKPTEDDQGVSVDPQYESQAAYSALLAQPPATATATTTPTTAETAAAGAAAADAATDAAAPSPAEGLPPSVVNAAVNEIIPALLSTLLGGVSDSAEAAAPPPDAPAAPRTQGEAAFFFHYRRGSRGGDPPTAPQRIEQRDDVQ